MDTLLTFLMSFFFPFLFFPEGNISPVVMAARLLRSIVSKVASCLNCVLDSAFVHLQQIFFCLFLQHPHLHPPFITHRLKTFFSFIFVLLKK